MELKLTGKLTREEELYIRIGPYIRRRSAYYFKVVGVAFLFTSAIILARLGLTATSLVYVLTLAGFLVAIHIIRLACGIARICYSTKEQEYEGQFTFTPETVALDVPGWRGEVLVSQLSIRNDRRGVVGYLKGHICFVPERALSSSDRAALAAMYGLEVPNRT